MNLVDEKLDGGCRRRLAGYARVRPAGYDGWSLTWADWTWSMNLGGTSRLTEDSKKHDCMTGNLGRYVADRHPGGELVIYDGDQSRT